MTDEKRHEMAQLLGVKYVSLAELTEEEAANGYFKFCIPGRKNDEIGSEGVWGWADTENKALHDDDNYFGTMTAVLDNDPFMLYTDVLCAGMEVQLKCRGTQRPVLDVEWLEERLSKREETLADVVASIKTDEPELIHFAYNGIEYLMTEEQIEAAYRYQQYKYHLIDAKRWLQIIAFGYDDPAMDDEEYVKRQFDMELESFKEIYEADYFELAKNIGLIADLFRYDTSTAEDMAWEDAIDRAARTLKGEVS